jgi:cell division protein FtsB
MAHLSVEEQNKLPESDFAVPKSRQLPIHDATHIRLAHDMLDHTSGLTPEERNDARNRIVKRAAEMGIDVSEWKKISGTSIAIGIEAMSLDVPNTGDHPNKRPFKGILTRIDEPSDAPPNGSGGRLVVLTKAAAEAALGTLLGMAVDCSADLSQHADTHKIGIITAANIVGNAIEIEGFFYAQNFPAEMKAIDKEKSRLGFSFELNPTAYVIAPGNIFQVNSCVFTGAAVLYRDKAAYHSTSLAAATSKEFSMPKTPEELQAELDALTQRVTKTENENAALKAQLEANATVMSKVEPHAKALETCAAGMAADGIGGDPKRGHVAVLNRMAGSMRASAALGNMPAIYRDHDYFMDASAETGVTDPKVAKELADMKASLEAAETQIKDLKAAKREGSGSPARKTISASEQALLSRFNLTPDADGKLLAGAELDAALKSVTDPVQRITIKRTLERIQQGLAA